MKYRWRYFNDDLDFANYPFSYLLIIPFEDNKKEIRIIFKKLIPPMLLPGFSGNRAAKNGEECCINLNEPRYIREITEYLLEEIVDFNIKSKWTFDDGETILVNMGYQLDT